jgi:hypothetical protein
MAHFALQKRPPIDPRPFQLRFESGRMPRMVDSSGTSPPPDPRLDAAQLWLEGLYQQVGSYWQPVTGDASHRRYFRVQVNGESRIVMDAPPYKEDATRFVEIAARLRACGLHAPEIIASDLTAGYVLLEDLGDELYRDLIDENSVQDLFEEAFPALAVMANQADCSGLPAYTEDLLYDEMYWFVDFYLNRHRHFTLNHAQRESWARLCDALAASALEQPTVFVHKDIHSCNLLKTVANSPGIIDFQDAVAGPLSYDFVSLVWDRYIRWPRARLEGWMEQFRLLLDPELEPETWVRWCDLMSLQRNIKIVGRFAILDYKEGKAGYVDMIPRFYQYILDVLPRYPQFADVAAWIRNPECAP